MKKKQWKLHARKGWSLAVEIAEERDQLREDLKAALDDNSDLRERVDFVHEVDELRMEVIRDLEAKVKELEYVIPLVTPPPTKLCPLLVGDFPPWNGGWTCSSLTFASQN